MRFLTPYAPHNWMPFLPYCFSEQKKKNGSFSIITIKFVEPPMKPIWLDADMRRLTLTIDWSWPRLQRCWEEKLLAQRQAEEEAERFHQRPVFPTLAPALREPLEQIGPALPALWRSGKLSNEHKKRLLRSLISRVIATKLAVDLIEIKIVWVSGHFSLAKVIPPIHRQSDGSQLPGTASAY